MLTSEDDPGQRNRDLHGGRPGAGDCTRFQAGPRFGKARWPDVCDRPAVTFRRGGEGELQLTPGGGEGCSGESSAQRRKHVAQR